MMITFFPSALARDSTPSNQHAGLSVSAHAQTHHTTHASVHSFVRSFARSLVRSLARSLARFVCACVHRVNGRRDIKSTSEGCLCKKIRVGDVLSRMDGRQTFGQPDVPNTP